MPGHAEARWFRVIHLPALGYSPLERMLYREGPPINSRRGWAVTMKGVPLCLSDVIGYRASWH